MIGPEKRSAIPKNARVLEEVEREGCVKIFSEIRVVGAHSTKEFHTTDGASRGNPFVFAGFLLSLLGTGHARRKLAPNAAITPRAADTAGDTVCSGELPRLCS